MLRYIVTVTGFWKEDPEDLWNKKSAVGEWDGEADGDIFYWFDNFESIIGDHGDFIVTKVDAPYFYRAVVFWSNYESDRGKFSDCSTVLNVVGDVLRRVPTNAELLDMARADEWIEDHASRTFAVNKTTSRNSIEIVKYSPIFKKETQWQRVDCYIGLFKVPGQNSVIPVNGGDSLFTREMLNEALMYQDMDISDMGEDLSGDEVIIQEGWGFDPLWKLHGYDPEKSLEALGIEMYGFSDDSFICDGCYKVMSTTDGIATNVRWLEDGRLGIECGCYTDHCIEHVEDFLNNTEVPMTSDALLKLKEKGLVSHYSDMCNGWSCGSDDPGEALENLSLAADEGALDFVDCDDYSEGVIFSLDWVGQFDTGFSMWVYRDRPTSKDSMILELETHLKEKHGMNEEHTIGLINSKENSPFFEDYEGDYVVFRIAQIDGSDYIVEGSESAEYSGSAYNALRAALMEIDEWRF